MLRGQDFGGREHRHLIAVLDGDDGGFGGHDGLAAAHVALQQAVHRMRRGHIVGDLLEHALLRARRLERQHGFHALADAVVECERDAGDGAGFAALQRDAAFQPEELLVDQAELRGRAEGVEQAQIAIRRREVDVAQRGPAVRHLEAVAQELRQRVVHRLDGGEDAVHQGPQNLGGELARAFVDGHDAPHVERGLALVLVAGEDFELRVQHGELAGIAIEFHLAEERHLHPLGQHVGQVAPMEPLAHQGGARGIGEAGFEHPQAAPLESAHFDRAHLRDHGGHLARRELGDRLHVAAVLIAERHVAQQVFHRGETFGFEHPARAGPIPLT